MRRSAPQAQENNIAIKGGSIPSGQPRSTVADPIDLVASIDPKKSIRDDARDVLVHVRDGKSPAWKYTGVYSPFSGSYRYAGDGYQRNPKVTNQFMTEFGARMRKLTGRNYSFQVCRDKKVHMLMGKTFTMNKGNEEKCSWFLLCHDGNQYAEVSSSRTRDKQFWNDPDTFEFISSEVHTLWVRVGHNRDVMEIAISPLQTVKKVLGTTLRPSCIMPLKYQKASDFTTWDRSFVLHVDHRTCKLPLPLVDSLMGVYTPVKDKVVHGYPVWKRQCNLTSMLVNEMSDPVKRYLEKHGIRISNGSVSRRHYLRVENNLDRRNAGSFLISTDAIGGQHDANIIVSSANSSLIGTCVPHEIDLLLTDRTSLFTNPGKAFATWHLFIGMWVPLHVAFTPEDYFREAINLARLEVGETSVHDDDKHEGESDETKKKKNNNKKKKKRNKKKKAEDKQNETSVNVSSDVVPSGDETQDKLDEAYAVLRHLAKLVGSDCLQDPTSKKAAGGDGGKDTAGSINNWGIDDSLEFLLGNTRSDSETWTLLDDSITSSVLGKTIYYSPECRKWFEDYTNELVVLFSEKRVRQEDLTVLFSAGVTLSANAMTTLFLALPKECGSSFNNKIAKIICSECSVVFEAKEDYLLVKDAVFGRIGKAGKKDVLKVLKRASANLLKSKKQTSNSNNKSSGSKPEDTQMPTNGTNLNNETAAEAGCDVKDDMSTVPTPLKQPDLKQAADTIQEGLNWYLQKLDSLITVAASFKDFGKKKSETDGHEEGALDTGEEEYAKKSTSIGDGVTTKPKQTLTPDQVVAALSNCNSEQALVDVEMGVDLFSWDNVSEWTIDITEQAHKWFNKHKKKDKALCERIILRLILLSTGRWPYVLCKPLKSKQLGVNGKKISLYETKIDKAGRIIWEVATAFSPRRSSLEQNFCEQVIRVWDIVLDHDNLSRAIDLTIDRIEKSHLRGEECALYAEIDKSSGSNISPATDGIRTRIPRVFPMSQEVKCVGSTSEQTPKGRSRHFHPASDDDRQFTLLKFYELNAGAVKLLLDGQDESMDLPFTPGPKEHEIIHFNADPQSSILLMGRSGTGKTTCLVFRMWAQYAQYMDGQQGSQPRQLFLTKNDVLCREVERSFNNMGLAWRKRVGPESFDKEKKEDSDRANVAKFLTSSEWLDALELSLPGNSFFSPSELEQRVDRRKQKDSVTKGVEDLLAGETMSEKDISSCRSEMTFVIFRKLWRKIRSGSGSQMDCTMVWREIKSFIKGSVAALQIGRVERDLPQNRFLSLEEYLALPRKQSRMDESQRREIYDLYLNYEKLKKEGSYYDECDLVYNIAGRISGLNQSAIERMVSEGSNLLPIDSLFVDEVQDFTQAELYILAKICHNPNNLFLAGDTAQSIAVGVDFRFTDVRQIFYNHFGGIEPKLLQLSHNYRSHAGVLRLAACVVELLYHFFSNSLDKLPPDLGLFSGPKPVIMEVTSTADLVLMLEGAKRETSRIEFGAHQVVIVRSEEAKKTLPDEFGIDSDWVMTVQQSKGLEFDDVLLYDFFSDSPAKDLWRVVSSYTEEDIATYYADATVAASGVQKYDWESPMLTETRHLGFNSDQHKILETELKMLYTAITRARVNIFIAETNIDQSRPMFNYFQKRCVVDVVNKNNGLAGVRVFGVEDNNPQDWRNRGEYYLQNAEGDRQVGCLRLAAKCFDRAKDEERKKIALAFLAFVELEEQQDQKRKGKGTEVKGKLYGITAQLLEARDVGFLNKAALCLLRTGVHDEDAARMFELYAKLRFTQRLCDEKDNTILPLASSAHEKKYFSYAGKLFARCCQKNNINRRLALASFRNFVCAAMYDEAHLLLSSGMLPLQDGETFVELHTLCAARSDNVIEPIAHFQSIFDQPTDECASLRDAVKMSAAIGCRKLYKSDKEGFYAALQLVPARSDRIKLLSSIDEGNVGLVLSKKPWANHRLFEKDKGVTSGQVAVDIANMLVRELDSEGKHHEAATILENRGHLLDAANMYDQLSENDVSSSLPTKAVVLRARWVELMMLTSKEDERGRLISRASLVINNETAIPFDTRYSFMVSKSVLSKSLSDLFQVIQECEESVMWQHHILNLLVESHSYEDLLEHLPGESENDRIGFIQNIAKKLKDLAVSLRRKSSVRSSEEDLILTRAEGYFDLEPQRLDPTRLETNPLVNLRLREVLHSESCSLPVLPGIRHGFTQIVEREKMHVILSGHVYKKAALLLMTLDELIRLQLRHATKLTMQEHVDCLQLHIVCIQSMSNIHHGDGNKQPWIGMRKKINNGKQFAPQRLADIMLSENETLFTATSGNGTVDEDAIMLKRHTISALKSFASNKFYNISMKDKKEQITHAITYWRLLSFCEDSSYASDELRQEVNRIERHKKTVHDFWKKSYFINKSKGEIYPRLWLWAVESAPEDIMNSISVVERLIRTSYRDGLVTLSKIEQVSLLEFNCVTIFGALSLTYSESVSPPPIFITKQYIRRFLGGSDQECHFEKDGLGVQLSQALLAYCHKRFDTLFEKCVVHLENSAEIILSNQLLSLSKQANENDDDKSTFNRALHLSIFIAINAITFSRAGRDMDIIEYERGFSDLPSIPLQGNIKKLVRELQTVFTKLEIQASTFLDVAMTSNTMLKLSQDCYVLCRLRQNNDEVDLYYSELYDGIDDLLSNIPFTSFHHIFNNMNSKSAAFLSQIDSINDEEDEHGRKSDELSAGRVIVQFIKSKMITNTTNIDHLQLNEETHFQHWKSVMIKFVGRVKSRLREKTHKKKLAQDDKELNQNKDTGILEHIVNPFTITQAFLQHKQNAISTFYNAVADDVECTVCSLVNDPNVQIDRFNQWNAEGRSMSFPNFAKNYNMNIFGSEYNTSHQLIYHLHSAMHSDNAFRYNKQLEECATFIARLRLGQNLLHQVITVCDITGDSSWYLHTAEEARELVSQLNKAEEEFGNAVFVWSRQPQNPHVWNLIMQLGGLPQDADSFFLKKVGDEATMIRNAREENDAEDKSSMLNPEATTFVPKFTF